MGIVQIDGDHGKYRQTSYNRYNIFRINRDACTPITTIIRR